MTELSFLLELFLDPECPCNMRDKLVARIREVETTLTTPTIVHRTSTGTTLSQAQTKYELGNVSHGTVGNVVPIEQVAQTQAAAAAIASREQAIADSISGKIDKGRGSPRKF